MTHNQEIINASDRKPNWSDWTPSRVRKIVLGSLGEEPKELGPLPREFGELFDNLTHLYLWGVEGLTSLDSLPEGLECLDIRNCPDLVQLPELPASLEELILEDLPRLTELRFPPRPLGRLRALSLKGNANLGQSSIHMALGASPSLCELDLSGCSQLQAIPFWSDQLQRIELNGCAALTGLPVQWPIFVYRVGLAGAKALAHVPDFAPSGELGEARLDYLDLQFTTGLKALPKMERWPRTLFVHGSGLDLPDELMGEQDINQSSAIFAELSQERVPYHEVKLILLGNGRSGKSSLARVLSGGDFNEDEKSTHGIRFWTIEDFPFAPVDEPGGVERARLNIWDFAGQDLYHNTHRLFFQSRAVYLICETCAGPGADPDSDNRAEDEMPEGWDVARPLSYWRDQLAALKPVEGRQPPEVLFVRTKASRDGEDASGSRKAEFSAARSDVEHIDFDAQTGEGLEELRTQITKAVSTVLGPRDRRLLSRGALEVRGRLQGMIEKNNTEHDRAELEERLPRPAHPTLERGDFDQVVAELANDDYGGKSELLLTLLHRSGFLYWNHDWLPGEIVLDQRWAIDGIYTAFDRKLSWPSLEAMQGRCTQKDLEAWGWGKYSPAHRQLFLGFMESCGMAFRVGTTSGSEDEFVVPRALPEYSVDLEREASDYRGNLPKQRVVRLESKALSRDAVLELLVRLGRRWGRAGVFWAWGGQFESHRHSSWIEQTESQTFVHLNWRPFEADSFGGVLSLMQFGSDDTFLGAILNECRSIDGFKLVEIPAREKVSDSQRTRVELTDGPMERAEMVPPDELAAHPPGEWLTNCITVGLSFAGDGGEGVASWRDLPVDSLECWPLAFAAELRHKRKLKVHDYRGWRISEDGFANNDRKQFAIELAKTDFTLAFVSSPYLQREWCMYELMRMVIVANEREAQARLKLLDLSLPGSELLSVADFAEYWGIAAKEFEEDMDRQVPGGKDAASFPEKRTAWDARGISEWYECILDFQQFQKIKNVLNGDGGWRLYPVPEPMPIQDKLNQWCDELEALVSERVLSEVAGRAWSEGQRDRAIKAFIRACKGESDAGKSETVLEALSRSRGDDTVDDIRRDVKEKYEGLIASGHAPSTWVEFGNLLFPS